MSPPVKCVGLLAATHKRTASATVEEVVRWLEARGLRTVLNLRMAQALGRTELGREEEELGREADLLVTFGGDGTFLAAARVAGPHGKPLLGVNLGGFGVLAAAPRTLVLDLLGRALAGKAKQEERLMLSARVLRRGKEVALFWGLNDAVVVARGSLARLLRMETRVQGRQLSDFPADGVIISTPTGSTGYSLSAGGPLLDPRLRVFVITPICPHALSARPLVVPAAEEVEVAVPDIPETQQVALTVDGQVGCALESGDLVRVEEAPFSAKVLSFEEGAFYSRLRGKLRWGTPR